LTDIRFKTKMSTQIEHYVSPRGRDTFQHRLDHLLDLRCRVAVLRRVDRLATGNPGDQRFCRAGVWELRVNCGPGYRVYFARPGPDRILLLGGGSKASQDADIAKAVERWKGCREQT
jgi:putative addiction module killer protein